MIQFIFSKLMFRSAIVVCDGVSSVSRNGERSIYALRGSQNSKNGHPVSHVSRRIVVQAASSILQFERNQLCGSSCECLRICFGQVEGFGAWTTSAIWCALMTCLYEFCSGRCLRAGLIKNTFFPKSFDLR